MTRKCRQELQLPRIGERKRCHAPRVLVQDQRARDRRLGTLAAILALAKPAIDADRRALGFLEVHATRVDQLRCMTDFTPEPDRKARLWVWMGSDKPAHHLCDREIAS